ncbi:MAG: amidase [Pseudomonadota bacterium]
MKTVFSASLFTLVTSVIGGTNASLSDAAWAQSTPPAISEIEKEATLETVVAPTIADILAKESLSNIAKAIAAGDVTSEQMVEAYLERIKTIDQSGATLQSILSLNPNAIKDARGADAAFAAGEALGPLHGVPILLKDNIESADPVATTAGALALKANITGRDAPLAAGLREAGAIILGKTNLSQWANFRSSASISGWSALGGQVRNPHMLDRTPCGSSSGSGAATAAALAAGSVGTETNGSIICPSSMNGVVGFKPTVGLVSQTGIVPISFTQDTAGPMTRSVRDAALMLTAMADEDDTDFVAALSKDALQGKRIGVLRFASGPNAEVNALFDQALTHLEEKGATLIDIEDANLPRDYWSGEGRVLETEFKHTINAYLATTDRDQVTTRTLADLIRFNQEHADIELSLFDQDTFTESDAQSGIDNAEYQAALDKILRASRDDGIDKWLTDKNLDVLVAPSYTAAFLVDAVHGDNFNGGTGASYIAAIAGYPHLTVPMGLVRGLPVGLSFMASAGDDADVLAMGYAYEQTTKHIAAPAYLKTAEDLDHIARAMRPYTPE